MIIKIPLLCRSKKNSQRIIYNRHTNKPMIIQSEIYKDFERDCGYFLNKYRDSMINYPVNIKCLFYVKDRKKRDLSNLINAIQDVLVKYKILEDDNYNIVESLDGSRIVYNSKEEPKIIIEITKK